MSFEPGVKERSNGDSGDEGNDKLTCYMLYTGAVLEENIGGGKTNS